MQLKLDTNGHAILKDGHPVYISGGKEVVHNAAEVVKERDRYKAKSLFNSSKAVHEKFAYPADMIGDMFADHFTFEDGKPIANGPNGKIYSRQRPGELADFDEAVELLAQNTKMGAQLFRQPGAAPDAHAPAPTQVPAGPRVLPRKEFERMNPRQKMDFMKGGGRLAA